MIIVENGSEIINLIGELNLDFGAVKLDTAALEFTKIFSNEFYVIHSGILSEIPEAALRDLGTSAGVILFGNEMIKPNILPNIVYHFAPNMDKQIFRNQLNLLQSLISQSEVTRSQLISLNTELAQMTGALESELIRLKKAYEQKAPKRFEEIKGLSFYSKYSAGESMGGEFFDMFKTQSHVFILMSSTSSYLASNSILTFFSALKLESDISNKSQLKFIDELRGEIENINRNKQKLVEVHILTAIIDLSSYKISGYNLGNFEFKSSSGKEFSVNSSSKSLFTDIQDGKFEIQLNRSEKLLLTSPGFINNWAQLNSEFMPEDILTKPGIKSLDILDALFFQMKKNSESDFLVHDASVILMEVDRNVMVQI